MVLFGFVFGLVFGSVLMWEEIAVWSVFVFGKKRKMVELFEVSVVFGLMVKVEVKWRRQTKGWTSFSLRET